METLLLSSLCLTEENPTFSAVASSSAVQGDARVWLKLTLTFARAKPAPMKVKWVNRRNNNVYHTHSSSDGDGQEATGCIWWIASWKRRLLRVARDSANYWCLQWGGGDSDAYIGASACSFLADVQVVPTGNVRLLSLFLDVGYTTTCDSGKLWNGAAWRGWQWPQWSRQHDIKLITDVPCLFVDIIGGGGAKFMETRCAMAA